jgi:hypothetical protein
VRAVGLARRVASFLRARGGKAVAARHHAGSAVRTGGARVAPPVPLTHEGDEFGHAHHPLPHGVCRPSAPDLDMKVMALLAEGWQLYGSPYSQGRAGHDALVCQALVYTGIVTPED